MAESKAPELTPQCDICGLPMKIRSRKQDGQPFWCCQSFPRCTGSMQYHAGLESLKKGTVESSTTGSVAVFGTVLKTMTQARKNDPSKRHLGRYMRAVDDGGLEWVSAVKPFEEE